MKKPCLVCGQIIEALGFQRYCDGCKNRTCEQCGKSFQIRQQTQENRYCGMACYAIAQRSRVPHNKGKINTVKKTCELCGQTFDCGYKARQRFCSLNCSSQWMQGENHYGWKGGCNSFRASLMKQSQYENWRKSVLVRDGNRCQKCLDAGTVETVWPLHVHHIVPIYADPLLALETDNGIALCAPHHREVTGCEAEYSKRLFDLIKVPPKAVARQKRIQIHPEIVRRLAADGTTFKNISRHFHVSKPLITRVCKLALIGPPKFKKRERVTFYSVLRLIEKDLTAKQIAARENLDYRWVMWVARKWMERPFDRKLSGNGLTGNVLRRLQEMGLSQEAIGMRFGVNQRSISRYLSNARRKFADNRSRVKHGQ